MRVSVAVHCTLFEYLDPFEVAKRVREACEGIANDYDISDVEVPDWVEVNLDYKPTRTKGGIPL